MTTPPDPDRRPIAANEVPPALLQWATEQAERVCRAHAEGVAPGTPLPGELIAVNCYLQGFRDAVLLVAERPGEFAALVRAIRAQHDPTRPH